MGDDEPLESWLFRVDLNTKQAPTARDQFNNRVTLNRLDQALMAEPEGRVNYAKLAIHLTSRYTAATLSADEAASAQRLFFMVWERGGPGMNHVIDNLLESVALAMHAASVPFWKQLLDLSRPRDQSTTRRRTYALAALALLAIIKGDASAYMALAGGLTHPHEQVRALAAYFLAQAYVRPAQPLPPPIQAALADLATRDPAFVARYQARMALRQLGLRIPLDDPEEIYILKVQLRGDRATRTIGIPADHTLADLHLAIQQAFSWNDDHLYSFYMSGSRDDKHYAIHCPELDENWSPYAASTTTVFHTPHPPGDRAISELLSGATDDGEDEEDAGGKLYTTNAQIGALGLVPKHTFVYFFDYGDQHEFIVTVLRTEPQSSDDSYPRVVESKGKAPSQYYENEEQNED